MKSIFSMLAFTLVLISCGKYEKPFISFKSPEKRLIDKTWKLDKIVDGDGEEINNEQTFSFSIEGSDSIFVRTIGNDSYIGSWSWFPALDGKVDKQRIVTYMNTPVNPSNFRIIYDVKVLTSKELEIIDRDGATTANYRYYFKKQ